MVNVTWSKVNRVTSFQGVVYRVSATRGQLFLARQCSAAQVYRAQPHRYFMTCKFAACWAECSQLAIVFSLWVKITKNADKLRRRRMYDYRLRGQTRIRVWLQSVSFAGTYTVTTWKDFSFFTRLDTTGLVLILRVVNLKEGASLLGS